MMIYAIYEITLCDFRGILIKRRGLLVEISIESIADLLQMIPDTEAACQTSEAAVDNGDVYGKIKDRPEKEAASVTAWKRYQRLVAAMESRGGEFNRKSVIEAIFRGSDLVYVSH